MNEGFRSARKRSPFRNKLINVTTRPRGTTLSAAIDLIVPRKRGRRPYILQPPLGLGYIAAALQKDGFGVRIQDACLDTLSTQQLVHRCQDSDLVGISAYSCDYNAAAELVRGLKQSRPDRPVVLGGSHFSALPKHIMRELPVLDFGIVGEGEVPLTQLARHITEQADPDQLSEIEGLVYRKGDDVRINPNRFYTQHELPDRPAWEILELDRYPLQPNGVFSRGMRVAPLITSRGCPYACSFCECRLLSGNRVRRRPVSMVLDEMESLARRFRIDEFNILDSAFLHDGPYVQSFCEAMIERDLRIYWSLTSGVRIDTLTPEIARIMEKAGCYSMALGIESGSDRVLKDMKKNLTVDQVMKKVRQIRECSSIRLTGFFIIGYPTETKQDTADTIRLSVNLPLDRANFFNFQPLPGTSVFEELKRKGILKGLATDRLYIHDYAFSHPTFSNRWLKKQIRSAHFRFYSRPLILLGLIREIRSLSQLKILSRRVLAILFS